MTACVRVFALAASFLAVWVLGLLAAPSPALAVAPVIDVAAIARLVKQLAEMKKQLETAKSQLDEAKRMFEATTGSRGLGGLLRDGDFSQYLPRDATALYDGSGGGIGLDAAIRDIERGEALPAGASVPELEALVNERALKAAAANKAVAQKAYEGMLARFQTIEKLVDKIDETEDPKAIAELSARIAGEQAAIEVELNKIQLLAQMQVAEARLIDEQRREISRRILDPTLQEMPRIRGQ